MGMATMGMMAARQDCRKSRITTITNSTASKIVKYTSCTDSAMNWVGLKAISAATPGGISARISSSSRLIAASVSSALEPGRWKVRMGSAGLPSR